jgi:hypothetical protein
MSNEIKVSYVTGKTLIAFVYQEDGTERDFGSSNNGISLTEVAGAALYDGLYLGDCPTISDGDVIMAYEGSTYIGSAEYKPFDAVALGRGRFGV